MPNKFTITKRIAKHGKQAVIIVPALLQDKLKPGTLAQVTIDVIDVIISQENYLL